MKRAFRKYHRLLAPIICLPLALTIITGMVVTLIEEWEVNLGLSRSLILSLHTGEIFHLEGIYPMLNGLGLIGMLVTGMSMTGLFRKRSSSGPSSGPSS
ncbi:MAG: peptidase [Elainella sp.]